MSALTRSLLSFYHEFGLASVHHTGRDAYLIILARASRMIAYGTNALILALFFSSLGFSDTKIGLFMTLTMAGDVVLGLVLTFFADGFGRRRTLLLGSGLMVLSGLAFALAENFYVLLLAAVVGVISTSGSDFGPFRAIEESILSQLTEPRTRPDVLAWYVTIATLGSSVGTEGTGRVIQVLEGRGWTLRGAYHACFWVYAGMGAVNILICLCLSARCEARPVDAAVGGRREVDEEGGEAREALLADDDSSSSSHDGSHQDSDDQLHHPDEYELRDSEEFTPTTPTPLLRGSGSASTPSSSTAKSKSPFALITPKTRRTMFRLWFLLIIDSLADGMVPISLTNYFLDKKFSLAKHTLGDVTSASYFLAFLSTTFAGPLCRRLGLINTMVFTHLPSSISVLLFPFPSAAWLSIILLLIRTGLNNMDQAPRAAFIAGVVRPEERTAVMGVTSMLRTVAQTGGPLLTGLLAGNDKFWIAFVVAGLLRIGYDVGLFFMFMNTKLHEYEVKGDDGEEEEQRHG